MRELGASVALKHSFLLHFAKKRTKICVCGIFFVPLQCKLYLWGIHTNYLTPCAYERAKSNIVYLARDLPLFG